MRPFPSKLHTYHEHGGLSLDPTGPADSETLLLPPQWRKFGFRHVIHEFMAYLVWLFTYTVFLLLLPAAQKGTGALREADTIDEEDLPGLGTLEGVIATVCLFTSFLFTLRNFWLEMKQIRAYGFKVSRHEQGCCPLVLPKGRHCMVFHCSRPIVCPRGLFSRKV